MAKRLSKLDRMGVAGEALSDEGLEDTKDAISDVLGHLEEFEDSRAQAIQSFEEAANYHEDRDWDSRDSSLEEAADAVEAMSTALDEIEVHTDVLTLPEGRMETLRKQVEEVQGHLGELI